MDSLKMFGVVPMELDVTNEESKNCWQNKKTI